MNAQIEQFRLIEFSGNYADARKHFDEFAKYPALKRDLAKNRQHLATHFGNIQTRLKTAGIRGYRPPDDAALEVSLSRAGHGEIGANEVVGH
jgi:hypothetical protein